MFLENYIWVLETCCYEHRLLLFVLLDFLSAPSGLILFLSRAQRDMYYYDGHYEHKVAALFSCLCKPFPAIEAKAVMKKVVV